jgi:hypothetical protein
MAKRRIKFKLGKIEISGVELEIEDDREQATSAFASLQNQIAGIIQPVVGKALLGAGQVIDAPPANGAAVSIPRKRRKLTPAGPAKAGEDPEVQTIKFIHDPDKFGNPQQSWSTPNKGIWTLWVVEQATGRKELTISEIVNAFNQHYRQFGIISSSNLSRDMAGLRRRNPPPVGADTNRTPQTWFLHDAGKVLAQRLAKGGDNGKAE